MHEPRRTGDQAVDAALDALIAVDELPLAEQVTRFDAVQTALADRLAES